MTDTLVPQWKSIKGLSTRQSWQVWRECVVHELVVKRAKLFPIARLMLHGAVLAGHGDALANGLFQLDKHDWAQEVWSLAAMGLQLQELYISTKFMSPWSWDELASASPTLSSCLRRTWSQAYSCRWCAGSQRTTR